MAADADVLVETKGHHPGHQPSTFAGHRIRNDCRVQCIAFPLGLGCFVSEVLQRAIELGCFDCHKSGLVVCWTWWLQGILLVIAIVAAVVSPCQLPTLLGTPGLATRSKDATRGSWPRY